MCIYAKNCQSKLLTSHVNIFNKITFSKLTLKIKYICFVLGGFPTTTLNCNILKQTINILLMKGTLKILFLFSQTCPKMHFTFKENRQCKISGGGVGNSRFY